MVKPDVIVVGPTGMDYPLWRSMIERDRVNFGRVIMALHPDYRPYDASKFLKEHCPWATIIELEKITSDWRHDAVRRALAISGSDWVLFMEQDFYAYESPWVDAVLDTAENYDVVGFPDGDGWVNGVRLHPAFILVRRSLVNQTSMEFGAKPDVQRDHFGLFCDQLLDLKPRLYDLSVSKDVCWHHWAGLTGNLYQLKDGGKPNYRLDDLKEYARLSLAAPVEQHEGTLAVLRRILEL